MIQSSRFPDFTQKISSSADQNVCPVGGDDTGVGKVVGVLGGVAVSLIVIAVIAVIAVCYKVSCLWFQMLRTTSRYNHDAYIKLTTLFRQS